MPLGSDLVLVTSGLVFVSILAGLVATRTGVPLLLVFLGLGMLAGADFGLNIAFGDIEAAYIIGQTALAIILFDGGVRTRTETLRLAAVPALLLATVGVVLTAGLTGVAAHLLLPLSWSEGLLMGAVVASTDAAAVFFLLNLRGLNLVKRVSAVLEAESGLNDPMAVFLTVSLVTALQSGAHALGLDNAPAFALTFGIQMVGGAAIGLAGGFALVALINGLRLASGLYPIFALSGALIVFAGAQSVGASGFLAIYLAGVVLGNRRHRATKLIERFQDGVAWLSQIGMFLLLGLLVDLDALAGVLAPALAVAAVLILVSRPIAVAACLLPCRFSLRETAFVSWVGLRGAVPIFLGLTPLLSGLDAAGVYYNVACVVVVASLIVQGWTLTPAARLLSLALPPKAPNTPRVDVDLPGDAHRDLAAFVVQDGSPAAGQPPRELPLGEEVTAVSIMRDGRVVALEAVDTLLPGDTVLVVGPGDRVAELDSVFGWAPEPPADAPETTALGAFVFDGETPVRELEAVYDLQVPEAEHDLSLNMFMRRHVRGRPVTGDRLRLGSVELIVRAVRGDRITRVGLDLEPQPMVPIGLDTPRIWLRHLARRLARRGAPPGGGLK